jgi:mRNA-degrading endonuclease RelE of RelBE toxin-antitoxin system
VITPQAAAQIDALPRPIRARVYKIFERLRRWPDVSGAKPLSGDLAGHYRMRTGDYRVQFRIVAETIVIERVGHRDGFYDD